MAVISPIVASRGLDVGSAPSAARDDSVGTALRGAGQTVRQISADMGELELRSLQQRQKIEDFQTEQRWAKTKLQIAADYDAAKTGIDPSGQGFAQNANKAFIEQYDAFLKTVPARLQGEFSAIVSTDKRGRDLQAAADEVAQRNAWYEVGVGDTVNAAQTDVAAYPEAFDQTLGDVYRTIDATGLPPAKKLDLKRNAEEMLGRAWFEAQMRADPAFAKTLLGVGVGSNGDAAGLIKGFEGFRSSAYADTRSSTGEFDAYRAGYGSDTVTLADGTVKKVTASTVVTPADAERDLARRVKEFEGKAAGQVGADQWASLPAPARAALTSVTYNYGSLPDSVVAAAKSGNVNAIAGAVERLDANPERRAKEAAVIRGGGEPAYEVADLPFSERLKLYDQAVAAENQLDTQVKAQARAAYDAEKGGLKLAIAQGEVASPQTILESPLDDSDKAILLGEWQTQQQKTAGARAILDARAAGVDITANPYDTDQRKAVGDAYDLLMKSTPDEQKAAVTAGFVSDTGVVPDPVVATVRQALAGTTVDDVGRGLELAATLTDVAPTGLSAVPNGKDISDAASVYDTLVNDRGMTVDEAAQRYIEMHDPARQEKVAVLKQRWTKESKKLAFSDVVAAFDDRNILTFGGPADGLLPAQQDAITKDYLTFAEENFVTANGDIALAKDMAIDQMKKVYGVSSVAAGPSMIMKFPPEKSYPAVGGDQSYIRDLALKDARSIDPKATNVMLVPDTDTNVTAQDIQAGNRPRYLLLYTTAEGVHDIAPGHFVITDEELAGMQAVVSKKREIELSIANEFAKASKDPAILAKFPAAGGKGGAVRLGFTPEAVVPGYAQKKQQLVDLEQQQQQLLGTTPAPAGGLDMDQLLSTSIAERAKALSAPYGGAQ